MLKIKKIFLLYLTMLFVALLSVCCVLGVQSVIQASAASPKYTVSLSGTSTHRTWGGSVTDDIENQTKIAVRKNNTSGATEDIILYLTTSSYSGTDVLNNNDYINFAYVKFESSISSNTLKILNSTGGTVASGKGTVSATLSNGQYQVTLNHSKSSGAGYTMWGIDVNVHCYFNVDTTKPTISGGSTSTTGKYTNTAFTVSASDSGSGVEGLYMRTPSSSTYTRVGTSKTVTASSTNGRYYFYAKDKAGNQSSTYYVNLDTGLPAGTIRGTSGNLASGSYTNKAFSYSATDSQSGISSLQYKKPGSSSWQTYTSGTSIPTTSTDGWYYFRALDKAGNYSAESSVYLDTVLPTCSIKRDDVVVPGGNYVQGTYVLFSASDSGSGILSCYVKKPGSSSFLAYTNNSPLTAEGRYEFYAVDKAGNQTGNYSITLDNTVPTGTLYGGTSTKTSGCFVNSSYVKYTASDTNSGILALYVKKPGSSSFTTFTDGTTFSAEGKYEFYSADRAGNESTHMTITLDLTKPAGSIYGGSTVLSSGAKTNAAYVKYTATDALSGMSKYYVKKPGAGAFESYTSGAQLTADGLYEFYSVDIAGNESVHMTVTLDKTKPNGQIYAGSNASQSGSSVNASYVRFTATDALTGVEKLYVMMPGTKEYQAYNSTTQLTAEGKYSFYAEDVVGNRSDTYTVTLDRTSPAGNLYAGGDAVTDGEITNAADITFKATDNIGVAGLYVKKPNADSAEVFTSETMFTVEGEYEFYAVDGAGNKSPTFRILLDKTKPTIEVKGGEAVLSGGAKTNAAFLKMTAHDGLSGVDKLFVKLPGDNGFVEYTDSAQLTAEGEYSFYATDRAGNNSGTVTVLLDRTKPIGHIYAGEKEAQSGTFTNAEYVKYSATDSLSGLAEMYVKKPGDSKAAVFSSGTVFTKEGLYEFYSVDQAGNKSDTIRITLDKTNPALTLYAGNAQVSAGAKTNAAFIRMQASDGLSGIAKLCVKLPGAGEFTEYVGGTQLTAEGEYSFYCTDRSGNKSATVTIVLDKTKPVGILYAGETAKGSGTFTNAEYVKYAASDSGSGVAGLYVKKPGDSEFESYTSDTQLTAEGAYSFYAVDRAGNQSETVTITLDKTNPTGTLYGGESSVNSGDATNAAYIKFIAQDETALSGVFVKLPGGEEFVSYTSGTELTDEGTYEFYATDKASNQSQVYTITLDRKIPAAQLYVDGEAFGNNGYTNGEHIRFECAETCYVKQPGSETFEAYLPGTEFYKPGKYVFYGESEAGNRTGYFTITIDRTQKPLEVSGVADGKTDGDVILSWTDGDPEQFAPVVSVTVNGKAYTNGATIYTIDTGVYEIVCTDAAGNEWTARFTSSKQNVLTETLQKEYWEAPDAAGEFFSFATYESAFNFAAQREYGYVRTGEWNSETWDTGIAMDAKDSVNAANGKYFIYKKSGNPEELVAYFTEERLNEVIAEYAKIGIESYYYWEKAPATISDGENLYSYSDGKTILADAVQLGGNIGCLLDGEAFVGTVVETEGRHVLTVLDDWGNTCEYNLIIIRTAPEILYAAGEGNANAVTFDRTYYFKDAVTISIADAFDEMAMFNVYGEDGSLIGSYSLGETYTIEGSGVYTVEAVNHFGKSQVFSLIISRNAPEIEMTKNTEDKTLDVTISESLDAQSHIQTIEIYKSADGGETWVLLTADDYGTAISVENLVYRFRTSGLYRVVVTDEFRTGIDAIAESLSYTQAAPDGVLKGVENGGYTNGTVTFEWKDEATVTMKKDGKVIEYTSGKKLTEDGKYEITFENFDGYKTTYTFIIDTAAPEIVLSGAKDGETVNGDVCAAFEGEGVTAELFKDGKSLGAYVSGTVIAEDGAYKIVVTDLAQNKTEVEFSIDKTADYAININDKGLSNSVTVTANEEVTLVLTKNGEAVEYKLGDVITAPAAYTLTITDALGNKAEVSFTIVEPLVQKFEHNFDETPGFEKALVNGEEKRLNYGTLELFEDGTYEVGIVVNGKTYTFTVTVDCTAPTLKLDGVENGGTTKGGVILSELTESATVEVYRDGKKIEYTLGSELTEVGQYRVVVTDEIGNSSEYTFAIEYSMNGGIIALIVIAAIAVVALVVVLIIRQKKKSEKAEEPTEESQN